MHKVFSKALETSIEVARIIGRVDGSEPGPCLVFIGGVHGNEPAGVFALHKVMQEIKEQGLPIKGTIIAMAGNLWALEQGKRYQQEDLNRMWDVKRIRTLLNGTFEPSNEDEIQQLEMFKIARGLLENEKGPFYFFDLHTTSSETIPFLTVNDSLLNRKFTEQYPVPMILGIEEYLDGPLLSYINELGYVSFGFEGGQHDDINSIENHIAFVYLSMVFAGSIDKAKIDYSAYFNTLKVEPRGIYEIFYRYGLNHEDNFQMEPGFANFQEIRKGELLAKKDKTTVNSKYNSLIFMPLYQSQGDDGFFLIRSIPGFFLQLSEWLRKLKVDRILPLMPGISWAHSGKSSLIVNQKVARFLAKPLLHLLGYRSKTKDESRLIIKNRESASRKEDYKNSKWYTAYN